MLPNMKTIVLACTKPLFVAMKLYYAGKVKVMQETSYTQTDEITKLQTQVAELAGYVMGYKAEVIQLQVEMERMKSQSYTTEELNEMEERCKELSFICSHLYTLVQNKLPSETLPDWDDPIPPTPVDPQP